MRLFERKKTYPSIIISEEKVQVLQLGKTGKRVINLAEVKLEKSVVKDGEVQSAEKLSQALKELFQAAKIEEHNVVVGIPENKSYTKVLTLPKLKSNELSEAVNWEGETYLPLPLDQVFMDWKIISEEKKGEVNILLIAVPKEIINGYTKALQLAGLTPVAYETTALSLVRLVEDQKIRTLIIEIGLQHAVLTLSHGKAIEASSIVSFQEGNKDDPDSFFIDTINKMLDFYEKKKTEDGKVSAIFVCGENSTQSLLEQIAKATSRKTKPCPMPVSNLPEEQTQNYVVAASLAKKRIEAPYDELTINLLPPEIQSEFDQIEKYKRNKLFLTISTVIMTIITISSLITLFYLQGKNSSLESQKLTISLPNSETGIAVKQTNQINYSARVITNIGTERIFPHGRLALILQNIPEGIQITSISIDEMQKKLRIVGRAQTRDNLLKLKDNLEGTEIFSEAILPLSSLQQAENIDFILTTTLNEYDKS